MYAVFVGLGTMGTVMNEMTFFDEPFRWSKIGLIVVLIIGILGLKMVTDEAEISPSRTELIYLFSSVLLEIIHHSIHDHTIMDIKLTL